MIYNPGAEIALAIFLGFVFYKLMKLFIGSAFRYFFPKRRREYNDRVGPIRPNGWIE